MSGRSNTPAKDSLSAQLGGGKSELGDGHTIGDGVCELMCARTHLAGTKLDGTVNSDAASGTTHDQTVAISQEQEFFLYELETSTDAGSIGLVLRSVCDSLLSTCV
jgi:hypothetical protein